MQIIEHYCTCHPQLIWWWHKFLKEEHHHTGRCELTMLLIIAYWQNGEIRIFFALYITKSVPLDLNGECTLQSRGGLLAICVIVTKNSDVATYQFGVMRVNLWSFLHLQMMSAVVCWFQVTRTTTFWPRLLILLMHYWSILISQGETWSLVNPLNFGWLGIIIWSYMTIIMHSYKIWPSATILHSLHEAGLAVFIMKKAVCQQSCWPPHDGRWWRSRNSWSTPLILLPCILFRWRWL